MGKLILTVDDSGTMRSMVALTLKGAGFEVLEAADGVEALARVEGRKVDLVLTDVNMPNMDGFELVAALRGNADFKDTPIFILSTESDEARKRQGEAAGATGWIVKPFEPGKLLQIVNRACS